MQENESNPQTGSQHPDDQAPPIDAAHAAARFLRLLGVVQSIALVLMAVVIIAALRGTQQPLTRQQALLVLAGLGVVGVLPAASYLSLASRVSMRNSAAVLLCLWLVLTQMIVLSILLLQRVVMAVSIGSPAAMTFTIVTTGTLLGLLAATARWLIKSRTTR